jgi:predicted transcriptional regulator
MAEGENVERSVVLWHTNDKYLNKNRNICQACETEINKEQQIKLSVMGQYKSRHEKSNPTVKILKLPAVNSSIPVGAVHMLKVPIDKWRSIIISDDRIETYSGIPPAPTAFLSCPNCMSTDR